MIAPQIVAEVRRLLAERKHSQRKIARLTGICRGTVGAIASGRRPDYEPDRDEDEWEEPVGSAQAVPQLRRPGLRAVPSVSRAEDALAENRRPAPRRAIGGDRTSRWS